MKDYWDGNRFICDGVAWGVAPDLSTFCVGVIDAPASDIKAVEALPAKQDIVLLQNINSKVLPAKKQAVVMLQKHGGGRPVKQGAVTRMTEWRRQQKELQGVLI